MRKAAILLTIGIFMLASVVHLQAASLAGVNLPDTIQVRGTPLVLNGMGLRTNYLVQVSVAGLYLEQKSADPDAIIKSDATKAHCHAIPARCEQESDGRCIQ